MVSKGFTPHSVQDASGQVLEVWYDSQRPEWTWSQSTALIAFMFFILVLVKGWPQ